MTTQVKKYSIHTFFLNKCSSTLIGALILVSGSIISKLSTFLINVYIARKVNTDLFGIGFVSVALITTLSQSFNKKCFRRVALHNITPYNKNNSYESIQMQSSINICWLSILTTFIFSIILCAIWLYNIPSNIINRSELVKQYIISVIVVTFSSIIESLSEPFVFNLIKQELVFFRSLIEVLSGIFRSLVLIYLITINKKNFDIVYYSIGQFTYSFIYFISSLIIFYSNANFINQKQKQNIIFLPKILDNSDSKFRFFLKEHFIIFKHFLINCIQSTILQETDKILVLNLFSTIEWSNYGVISNLANIVTRVLFLPIEEIGIERFKDIKIDYKSQNIINHVYTQLSPLRQLLFFTTSIGVLAISFGPFISSDLINVIYGGKWVNYHNIVLFSTNIYLLSILSLHGILETFVFSIGGIDQISKYRKLGLILFVIHVITILIFRDYGFIVILLSNNITLIIQILYCLKFVYSLIRPIFFKMGLIETLNSFKIFLIEKNSKKIYTLFVIGGLFQRLILTMFKNIQSTKEFTENSFLVVFFSSVIALIAILASIPSFLCILNTNKS